MDGNKDATHEFKSDQPGLWWERKYKRSRMPRKVHALGRELHLLSLDLSHKLSNCSFAWSSFITIIHDIERSQMGQPCSSSASSRKDRYACSRLALDQSKWPNLSTIFGTRIRLFSLVHFPPDKTSLTSLQDVMVLRYKITRKVQFQDTAIESAARQPCAIEPPSWDRVFIHIGSYGKIQQVGKRNGEDEPTHAHSIWIGSTPLLPWHFNLGVDPHSPANAPLRIRGVSLKPLTIVHSTVSAVDSLFVHWFWSEMSFLVGVRVLPELIGFGKWHLYSLSSQRRKRLALFA